MSLKSKKPNAVDTFSRAAAHNHNSSAISQAALQLSPMELIANQSGDDRPVQMNDGRTQEIKRFSLPAENDQTRDRNIKPFQLKQNNTGLPGAHADGVVQGVFLFTVNTDNYTIFNTQYHRVKGAYMTGNSEFKHVTADSVKDELWTGMEGMSLSGFAKKLISIAEVYQSLPGVDLVHAHPLNEDEDAADDRINGPMRENFKAFDKVWNSLSYESSELHSWLDIFSRPENDKTNKDAAAFHIQNKALQLISSLDKFRDLMPLVNVVSGLQKRGKEPEAKAFLKDGIARKGIQSENAALWAFFDFAAIDELTNTSIEDSIPWINLEELRPAVAENTGKQETNVTVADINDAIAGIMLANHIKLTSLSYPAAAARAGFGTVGDVQAALNAHDSPVNRPVVANYAVGGWDFFK